VCCDIVSPFQYQGSFSKSENEQASQQEQHTHHHCDVFSSVFNSRRKQGTFGL
jgi:hypothetical protein